MVRGDAGIGKSALLQHLVDAASGFTMVHATGVESEMEIPFAALHQLCTSMLDRLDTLPDPQRAAASTAFGLTTGTSPDRLLIGLAVLNLLCAVSDDGPLLCVVDDAQWLDRASAQALSFVARRLLAEQVGLVFATRQPHGDLAGLPELGVGRLNDGAAQMLLSAVLHVPLDERVRDRIVAETHGNPLALVEWPRGLTPTELEGGFGMPAVMPMSGQIEESFRRRLVELPVPTQRFLTVAAAEPTGDPVIVWRAARSLGVEPHDASPAIDAGLVEIGVHIWFRHPLVRSAAYGAASLADRQATHRELAQATDPELDPDRRAWHRALGSPGPDEEIAAALERSAGRARTRGGFAAAGALLERAVALTVDPSRRAQRVLAAAASYLEAGSYDLAAALLALAETTPLDELGRAELDFVRARLASWGGDPRVAPELLLRAAKQFEPLDVGLAQAVYLQAMAAACVAGNFARGAGIGDIARAAKSCPVSAAPTTGEWLVAGLARVTADGPAAAAPSLRRALQATPSDMIDGEGIHWLGYQCGAASVLWDHDSLHRLAALHVTATRGAGALTMLPWALNSLAHTLTLEGDLEHAAALVVEADQILEATGNNFVSYVGALLAAWRADDDSLRSIRDHVATARAAGNALALKSAQWANAILYNGMGQYEQALAVATEADQQPWEWGAQNHFHELIEAAVRCGQRTVASAALERLAETTEPSGSDWAMGIQSRSRALLADGGTAEDCYREAIDRLARTSIRPELARSHLLYGEWLRRENRRVEAREHLRAAHEMFTTMGIHGFAERTRHELLATGETVRKRAGSTFDEFTPQEAHIARLAAEGRTNPEIGAQLFISPRTVEWHLRKVFTKLGVTSRRQLRETLSRPSLTSSP